MKLIERIKNVDYINKCLLVATLIIVICLILNLIITMRHISQFNSIKNSGNDRWFEVEYRIKLYENKVDALEQMLKPVK